MGYYPEFYGPALYDFYYSYGQRTAHVLVESVKEHLKPGARVLDIGTGTGFVAFEVTPLIDSGHVIGVDLDQDAIFLARHKAERRKVSNVTFQTGDATNLEFEDASFDVVLEDQLIGMFEDPQKPLREMLRVLRPGGVVGLGRPSSPDDEFWQWFYDVQCEFSARRGQTAPQPRDQWLAKKTAKRTIPFVRDLFRGSGVDILKLEQMDMLMPALSFEIFVLGFLMGRIQGFAKGMLETDDPDRESIVTACLDFLEIGKRIWDEKYGEQPKSQCIIAVGRK